MTTQSSHTSPILVTGAAGAVGSIGRNVTEMLLAKGHKVRALVRREDERAEALRQLGAEVMQGDLTDLTAMHRAIEGCPRVYFGMSVSADYLTATVNTAAVARHHGVEAFVNMSQMTVTQMSISESTDSPQHKLHWLAEQALCWSGLPVVTMRPTVFLDGFFRLFAAPGVRDADELALPMGRGKTSPISAVDVARAVSVVLEDPAPHIGKIYNLTGFESADLEHYARVFSEALGRSIRYRDVPLSGWSEKLLGAGVPAHVVKHLSVMTELNKQGRYDRMTDDLFNLTGQKPIISRFRTLRIVISVSCILREGLMHRDVLFAFFAAVFFSVFVSPAFAGNRVALVIGNGAYARVPHLPNPVHDAEDVAAVLKRSGFETIVATNLDKAGMDEAMINGLPRL